MGKIETPEEIGLSILGYHTVTKVKGVEIDEISLLTLLTSLGLSKYMPGLPESVTVLQRAVRRWLREISKADIGIGDDDKTLLRRIHKGGDILAFGLVVEKRDLIEWGLDYLTNLRIFYDKDTEQLYLRCTGVGQDYLSMDGTDLSILSQLEPHWLYYKKTYTSSDLSRMVTDMVKDMDSVNLKDRSGSYFVPIDKLDQLQVVKTLVEEQLPGVPENESLIAAFPQIDRPGTRKQLANLAYNSLTGDLESLSKKLNRFVEQEGTTTPAGRTYKVRKETILNQLTEYKNMKTKILLYKEKLGVQQSELLEKLGELEETASRLIDIEVDE